MCFELAAFRPVIRLVVMIDVTEQQAGFGLVNDQPYALLIAGDYAGAAELTNTQGVIGPELQADLDRLTEAEIPVDITFRQGPAVLDLD